MENQMMYGKWQPMDSAPRGGFDDKVLLLIEGKDGERSVHIGYFDRQEHQKRPKPYWRLSDVEFLGVGWIRENQPIAWMPLPSTEDFDGEAA